MKIAPVLRSLLLAGLVPVFVSVWSTSAPAAAPSSAATPPKGQTVYSAGHSFHVFMPGILTEIAKSAGIEGHKQVGLSSIGGSYTHQHWAKEGDQAAKVVVPREKPDVFTIAPIYLPDDGIENFVRLCAEETPQTRVLIQEFWLPFDVYNVNYKKEKPATPDRDAMTVDYLRTEYGKYFASMDAHVRELNEKYGKGQTRVFVTPVGQAVVALREKVIAGDAPGIEKQSELFTDPIGHCTAPIKVLNAYCHYAVIYGRSPVGLPVPAALGKIGDEETTAKLNTLLQEIAWNAVTSHPLSGVKK
jgi:hypothetical protein